MTNREAGIFVAVLVGLFAWCLLYARVLATHPHWYIPNNKTWVTVVVGVIWILIALGILARCGLLSARDWGIVTLCHCAGGAAMIIWQYLQDTKQKATLEATEPKENNRDGTSK